MVANGTVSPMPDTVERMEASDMRRECSLRDGEPVVPLRSMKTLPLLWMHSTEPTKITLLTHLDKKKHAHQDKRKDIRLAKGTRELAILYIYFSEYDSYTDIC